MDSRIRVLGLDWPLDRNQIRRGNMATFGMVRRSANGTPRAHQGWDLYATPGTPVYAVGEGTVIQRLTRNNDFGLYVDIRLNLSYDGRPLIVRYAHLQSAFVSRGDTVTKGQQIGTSGNSGNAQGLTGINQHLHIGFMKNENPGLGITNYYDPAEIYGTTPQAGIVPRESN